MCWWGESEKPVPPAIVKHGVRTELQNDLGEEMAIIPLVSRKIHFSIRESDRENVAEKYVYPPLFLKQPREVWFSVRPFKEKNASSMKICLGPQRL